MYIKEEVNSVSTQEELIGKIVDYQFLVKPKQEPVDDIKPNVDSQLVGEILTDGNVNETSDKKDYEDINSLSRRIIFCSCDKCSFQTNYSYNIERHIRSVHERKLTDQKRSYNCCQCGFKAPNKYLLTAHKKILHESEQKTFVCNKCGYETNMRGKLNSHSLIHNNVMYNCDLCPFKALSPRYIKRHKARFHFKIVKRQERFLCELCGKTFFCQNSLKRHLVRAHKEKIELETYICYTCGFKTYNKQSLIAHVQKHMKSSTMFCANCHYSTYSKTHLIQHMVKHMDNVKMYNCHICKFKTKRPHTLRHHIKTHL